MITHLAQEIALAYQAIQKYLETGRRYAQTLRLSRKTLMIRPSCPCFSHIRHHLSPPGG